MIRPLSPALLALVLAACGASAPSLSPPPAPTAASSASTPATAMPGTPTPSSALPTPSLSAAPSNSPSTTQSPAPSLTAEPPDETFAVDWHSHSADFGDRVQLIDSAVVDDRIVVIGAKWDEEVGASVPAIWWEDGDLVWRPAVLPAVTGEDPWLSDIVSGGPGLVVVGTAFDTDGGLHALIWLSNDGKAWREVDASAIDDYVWNATYYGQGAKLAATSDGLILFGRNGEEGGYTVPLVSTDGSEWRLSQDAPTREMAVASLETPPGDSGVALAGSGNDLTLFDTDTDPNTCGDVTGGCIGRVGPVRVWRAKGSKDWQMVGELPESADEYSLATTSGPHGWVAAGSGTAWLSSDGRTWHLVERPPRALAMIFDTPAGFVGVGGEPKYDFFGQGWNETWTSTDGRIWRKVDTIDTEGGIVSLRRRGATLIGIGMANANQGAVWTAELP